MPNPGIVWQLDDTGDFHLSLYDPQDIEMDGGRKTIKWLIRNFLDQMDKLEIEFEEWATLSEEEARALINKRPTDDKMLRALFKRGL